MVVIGLTTSGVGYGCLGFHALISSAVGYMDESHAVFHTSGIGRHVSMAAFASVSARVFLLRVTWVRYPPPPRASRQTFLIRLTDYGILCKQPVLGCRGFIVEDAAHEVGVAHVIHDVQSHLHAQPKPCLGANPLCSVGGMVYHAQVSARHPLRYMCRLRRWFGGGCGCRTGRLQ